MSSYTKLSMVIMVLVVVMLIGVTAQDCILSVPSNPLSATGLASLYVLSGAGCDQTTADGAVFVEAAIVRPSTGELFVYTPLVVNMNDQVAAVPPTLPQLHTEDVVGLWFGSNTDSVTLTATSATTLSNANCVNGGSGSGSGIFGQVAYCNGVAFFAAANAAIASGLLKVPPLGTGTSGQRCPSTRSFSVVDQDQSDNVLSSYLVVPVGASSRTRHASTTTVLRLAQGTVGNRAALKTATEIDNGSDNRLLAAFINPALGCVTWKVQDLADPTAQSARNSQALNELQAAADSQLPVALVPALNPMVLDMNGQANFQKLNAYRVGVGQPPVAALTDANTIAYCMNLRNTGLVTIITQIRFLFNQPSPDPATGTTLLTFLLARFKGSWDQLQCQNITGIANPVVLRLNAAGVAVGARVTIPSQSNRDRDEEGVGNNVFANMTAADIAATDTDMDTMTVGDEMHASSAYHSFINTSLFSIICVWAVVCINAFYSP